MAAAVTAALRTLLTDKPRAYHADVFNGLAKEKPVIDGDGE
jgi:hypothetical protein